MRYGLSSYLADGYVGDATASASFSASASTSSNGGKGSAKGPNFGALFDALTGRMALSQRTFTARASLESAMKPAGLVKPENIALLKALSAADSALKAEAQGDLTTAAGNWGTAYAYASQSQNLSAAAWREELMERFHAFMAEDQTGAIGTGKNRRIRLNLKGLVARQKRKRLLRWGLVVGTGIVAKLVWF